VYLRLADQVGVHPDGLAVTFRVQGEFQPAAFSTAAQRVFASHDGLDGVFARRGHSYVNVPVPVAAPSPVRYVDLTDGAVEEPEFAAVEACFDEAHRLFDLSRERAWRLLTIRIAPQVHLVQLTTSHVIMDGWSIKLVMEDISKTYELLLSGGSAGEQAGGSASYYDFVQQERLEATRKSRPADYWQRLFDSPITRKWQAPASLGYPFPGGAESGFVHDFDYFSFSLPTRVRDGLIRSASAAQCTPFVALTSVFALFLAAWYELNEVLIATAYHGRGARRSWAIRGCVYRPIFLKLEVNEYPTVAELFAATREAIREAIALNNAGMANYAAMLYSMPWLLVDSFPSEGLSLPGAEVKAVDVRKSDTVFSYYPAEAMKRFAQLNLQAEELNSASSWDLDFCFSPAAFPGNSIEAAAEIFQRLLQVVAEDSISSPAEIVLEGSQLRRLPDERPT
jgi:hypothetical protein